MIIWLAICNPGCQNMGTCVQPNLCSCVGSWEGEYCQLDKSGFIFISQIESIKSFSIPFDFFQTLILKTRLTWSTVSMMRIVAASRWMANCSPKPFAVIVVMRRVFRAAPLVFLVASYKVVFLLLFVFSFSKMKWLKLNFNSS